MKRIVSKPEVLAAIATFLFVSALVTALFVSSSNKSLKKNLSAEKLTSEKLLAEKLSLDKKIEQSNREIDQFNLDIKNLSGKNKELDNLLANSKKALSQKQEELNQMAKSNAERKAIELKLQELEQMKNDYENQIVELNSQIKSLNSISEALMKENGLLNEKISNLEVKNKELSGDNQLLKMMAADDYLIEGRKGKKDKLTLTAKKTNKLALNFKIPEGVSANLKFNIITPDGKKIDADDQNISITVLDSKSNTSSDVESDGTKLNKSIQMEYNPKNKFSRGLYKIEIYNNESYLGSCQVHLR